jgi:protein TonB
MAYALSEPYSPRRLVVFATIVGLHVLFGYILASGLGKQAVEFVAGPVDVEFIEEIEEVEEKPPPPPPKIDVAPPPFVPPPDIAIDIPVETSSTTAITNVTTVKPVVKAPAPAADVVVAPRSNPKRPVTEPDYPPMSKRLGEEGSVVLELYVLEDGRVGEAKVKTSSGFPRLDEAALKHVKRSWRLLPGTKNGKAAPMWYPFKVTFKIKVEKG